PGEVAARVGLAEELAPDLVTAQHGVEEALLLLLGAVGDDRRARHADADGEHAGVHVVAALFLVEDALLDAGAPAAAVLLRPRDAGPAVVVLDALPRFALADVLALGFLARRLRVERAGEAARGLGLRVLVEERTHLGAE